MYVSMVLSEPLKRNGVDEWKKILSGNSKDDIWLGKGMYFWDNRGNANWWKRKQCDKHPNAKYSIVAVNAILDNLLYLTDYDIYMKLDELWKQICQLSDLNSNVPLGEKLNFLFDSLGFGEKYDLIKVYGKYNYTPSKGFFKFDYKNVKSEPTIGVKCIYSIRNENCIIEKEKVREE